MGELIQPNWHMAVVHFPIALLVIGAAVEVFSFLGWRRGSFRAFGRWALLLGAIVAVPTTFGGLYALRSVAGGLPALEQSDPDAAHVLWEHLWMSAAATTGAMLLVVTWIAFNDVWRDRLSILYKLALLLVVALVLWSAHHGGQVVYAHKIGPHVTQPTSLPTSMPNGPLSKIADDALKLEQLHVYLAGFAAAMACVCVGWAIRLISQPDLPTDADEVVNAQRIAAAFSSGMPSITDTQLLVATLVADSPSHTPPVRTTRWWMLTLLLMLCAAASGLWYLAQSTGSWEIDDIKTIIRKQVDPEKDPELTRRYAHTIVGMVLIGQTLLLALASLVARRNKWLLILLAIPLLLALLAQVWLGLLLLDSPAGKVTEWGESSLW